MHLGKAKSKLPSIESHEEHDEELWLVSYADMVTLLFGFFVILFSFSTLDDKKFEQMTEQMAEAFKANEKKNDSKSTVGVSGEERQLRAMQMLISMLNLGESMEEAVAKIENTYAQSQNDVAAKKVLMEKVATQHRDMIQSAKPLDSQHAVELVLPDTSLFATGSHAMTPEAQVKLRSIAAQLLALPHVMQIEITGHTDSRPPARQSTYRNNFTLSSLRAGAVAEVFIRAGVDQKKLSVRGMGSLHPILPERDREGRFLAENMAKNRRVTILIKLRDGDAPLSH